MWMEKGWIKTPNLWKGKLIKLHRQFGHSGEEKIWRLMEEAFCKDEDFQMRKSEMRKKLKEIEGNCDTCKKFQKNPPRPVVALPLASKFNEVIAMDLGELERRRFILFVDMATNYIQAAWIKNKTPKEITKSILGKWIGVFGAPKKILTDNGLEFQNEEVKLLTEGFGIEILSTPAESPWSNGKCERMVRLVKDGMRKLLEEETRNFEIALNWTLAAKNCLMMKSGYSPNQLVFGRNPYIPNIMEDERTLEAEEIDESNIMGENLRAMHKAREIHIQQESESRIRKALRKNIREHKYEDSNIGDKVYYKRENEKRWRGPGRVIGRDGKNILVKHGGTIREVARVHILRLQRKNTNSCSESEDSSGEEELDDEEYHRYGRQERKNTVIDTEQEEDTSDKSDET